MDNLFLITKQKFQSADSDLNEEEMIVIYSVSDIRLKDEQECQRILNSESFEEYVRVLAIRDPYLSSVWLQEISI